MISKTKVFSKRLFFNSTWRNLKNFLKIITKCRYVKELELDELNQTFSFRRVFFKNNIKIPSNKLLYGKWEVTELNIDDIEVKVTIGEKDEFDKQE